MKMLVFLGLLFSMGFSMEQTDFVFTPQQQGGFLAVDSVSQKGLVMALFSPRREFQPVLEGNAPIEHGLFTWGGLSLDLAELGGCVQLRFKLFGSQQHAITGSLTHLKKGALYCAGFRWDGSAQTQFEFFFNSMANGVEDWQLPGLFGATTAGREYALGNSSDIDLKEVRIYNRDVSLVEIAKINKINGLASITSEARPAKTKLFSTKNLKLATVYSCSLAHEGDLSDWVLEGGGVCEIAGKKLVMAAENGSHQVLWNKTDMPSDFLAEWKFTHTVDQGLAIVFFCAKGKKGQDILTGGLKPRTGDFKEYHHGDFNCYHISYYAWGRTTCNLRKNYGMYLAAVGNDLVSAVPAGKEVKISLLKMGSHITLAVNKTIALEYDDDGSRFGPVLGAGKIGLRQMEHTGKAYYRDFTVYRVD